MALATGFGTAFVWISRRMVLSFVTEEFETMIERRHQENVGMYADIQRKLEIGAEDRRRLEADLIELKASVSFLRDQVPPYRRAQRPPHIDE
jgi:hypothetical protein